MPLYPFARLPMGPGCPCACLTANRLFVQFPFYPQHAKRFSPVKPPSPVPPAECVIVSFSGCALQRRWLSG